MRWLRSRGEFVAKGADRVISSLMFSPDATLLFSNAWESNTIWNTGTLRRQCQLDTSSQSGIDISCCTYESYLNTFTPMGKQVWYNVRNYANLYKWDSRSGDLVATPDGSRGGTEGANLLRAMGLQGRSGIFYLRFSPNGKVLAVSARDRESDVTRVYLADAASGKVREVLKARDENHEVTCFEFSSDGAVLAGWEHGPPYDYREAYRFHVWNLRTKESRVIETSGHCGNLINNGELLGIYDGSGNGTASFYRVATGALMRKYEFPQREKGDPGVAISPVGSCVAIAYRSRIYLDDWSNGTNIAVLDLHEANVSAMTFSNDGSLLATGDGSGKVILWKVASVTSGASSPPVSPTTD